MNKFALSWHEGVLVEVLGPGAWTEEEHVVYLALLTSVLSVAPVEGFDLLSDSLEYTMQVDAEADHQAYDMLAAAGCRRMVMVANKMSIPMQTKRMIRESVVGHTIEFTHVATMAEARDLLDGWRTA